MKKTLALLAITLAAWTTQANALNIEPYSAQALTDKQQAGEVVGLHFHAIWCPTCWSQEKVFKTFKGDASVPGTLLVVNYDTERELRRQLNVRTQSTVIVYKGKQEQKRLAGDTDDKVLRDVFTTN